jgi:hypothetical protein
MGVKKFIEGRIYYSTISRFEGRGSTPGRYNGRTIPQITLYRCMERDNNASPPYARLQNLEDPEDTVLIEGDDRYGHYPRLTKKRYDRMQSKLAEARTNMERYGDLFDRLEDMGIEQDDL